MSQIVDFNEMRNKIMEKQAVFPDEKNNSKYVPVDVILEYGFKQYYEMNNLEGLNSKGVLTNFLASFNINTAHVFTMASWFAQSDSELEEMVVEKITVQDYLGKYVDLSQIQYFQNQQNQNKIIDWFFKVGEKEVIEKQLINGIKFSNSPEYQMRLVDVYIKRDYFEKLDVFVPFQKFYDAHKKLQDYKNSEKVQTKINQFNDMKRKGISILNKIALKKDKSLTKDQVEIISQLKTVHHLYEALTFVKDAELQTPLINSIKKYGKADFWNDEVEYAAKALEFVKNPFLQNNLVQVIYDNRNNIEYDIAKAVNIALSYINNEFLKNKLQKLQN